VMTKEIAEEAGGHGGPPLQCNAWDS
jgi:hypothetical protein